MKTLNKPLFVGVASAILSLSCIGPCIADSPGSAPPPVPPVGSQAWAVVLCKFAPEPLLLPPPRPLRTDLPDPLHDVQWYRDFVTHPTPQKDGLWNFWYDVSYGQMDLTGSMVFGRRAPNGQVVGSNTLPHALSYYANLPTSVSRFTLWSDCANTATTVDFTTFYGVLAILNAQRDYGAVGPGQQPAILNGVFGEWGVVVLDSTSQDISNGAHEMGHAFSLEHNWDTALKQCVANVGPGVYCDPYDAMGYEDGSNTFQTSRFGNSSPGLTAPNLAKLRWIANPKVVDPSQPQYVGLSPIETQPSMIQVPIGDADQPHYYTVEYRDPTLAYISGTKWGELLPGPGIVIHEVRHRDTEGHVYPDGVAYLVDTGGGPNFQLCQTFYGVNNIEIELVDTPTPSDPYNPGPQALVTIGNRHDGVADWLPNYCNGGQGTGGLYGGGGGGNPMPPRPPCPPGWHRVSGTCVAGESYQ